MGAYRVPVDVEAALNDVATQWTAALATAAGVGARRATGEDFYRWLLPWFNPRAALAGGDPEELLSAAPYPGDADLPFGYDFAETLTLSLPRSDDASATWWFDGLPHTVVTVQGLRRGPGHRPHDRRASLSAITSSRCSTGCPNTPSWC